MYGVYTTDTAYATINADADTVNSLISLENEVLQTGMPGMVERL